MEKTKDAQPMQLTPPHATLPFFYHPSTKLRDNNTVEEEKDQGAQGQGRREGK
jgi:hypothetical protein